MSQSIQSSPEERTLVMKFGGTSVGSPEAMAMAVHIVQDTQRDWPRLVVVTSALSGVTDLLLKSAAQAVQGDNQTFVEAAESLRQKHSVIAAALLTEPQLRQEVIAEIDRLALNSAACARPSTCWAKPPRAPWTPWPPWASACASACWRAACAPAGTPAEAVEASRLIVTDDKYQSAHPDFAATTRQTRQVLLPLLDKTDRAGGDRLYRRHPCGRHHHPGARRQRLFGCHPGGGLTRQRSVDLDGREWGDDRRPAPGARSASPSPN